MNIYIYISRVSIEYQSSFDLYLVFVLRSLITSNPIPNSFAQRSRVGESCTCFEFALA